MGALLVRRPRRQVEAVGLQFGGFRQLQAYTEQVVSQAKIIRVLREWLTQTLLIYSMVSQTRSLFLFVHGLLGRICDELPKDEIDDVCEMRLCSVHGTLVDHMSDPN